MNDKAKAFPSQNKNMKSNRTKVLYILGHPFSGSTLFSTALGNSKNLVNLGEVSFLENDFHDQKRCICGNRLCQCQFWQEVIKTLEIHQTTDSEESCFQLRNEVTLSGPDQVRNTPLHIRLRLLLGVPWAKVYSDQELENYARKHETFFNVVSDVTGHKILIDVSKSPHRLLILSRMTTIDFRVVWLQRNMKGLFNSRIKIKKRRNRYYNPLFSLLNIVWLLAFYTACQRVYRKIPNEHKRTITYESFIKDPLAVQNELSEFLETLVDFDISANNVMKISDQHIYVGNRRVVEDTGTTEVRIHKPKELDSIGKIEEFFYRVMSLIVPVLRA